MASNATTLIDDDQLAEGTGPLPSLPCFRSPLLTTTEAAAYLRVSREWLEKMRSYGVSRGTAPKFTRVGRRCFYAKTELDAYIERNSARSTSEYAPNA